MQYWILNNKTNEPAICGNLLIVARYTGISHNSLLEHFSRKKEKEFNNDDFRICKLEKIKLNHE